MTESIPQRVVGVVSEFAIRLPKAVSPYLNSAMVKLIDMAIDGVAPLGSAKTIAAKHFGRYRNVDDAVNSIVRLHVMLATVQGVVSNIGGIVSSLIGTPVNVTGLIVVQVRMVACIAHLYGYDLEDPRVRTALAMCLLGDKELERQIADNRLPTTPAAVATSPVFDYRLHVQVADRILGHLLAESAGKGLVTTLGRRTPLIGGGVGGIADLLDTRMVSRCARKHLLLRRPPSIPQYCQEPVQQQSRHSTDQNPHQPGTSRFQENDYTVYPG